MCKKKKKIQQKLHLFISIKDILLNYSVCHRGIFSVVYTGENQPNDM